MSANKEYQRLLTGKQWAAVRAGILSRHPVCQRCEHANRLTSAREVHHIVPVETATSPAEMRALAFDESNLMALCHDCHVEIHREMGKWDKEAKSERNKLRAEIVLKRFFGD